jgi:uncharacterized membrane protein
MTNPIKPTLQSELPSLALLAAVWAAAAYFFPRFPDVVPIHWNIAGEADGFGTPAMAAFLIPGLVTLVYGLFLGMPYLDPKKDRYVQFRRPYHIFKFLIIAVLGAVYAVASLSALGFPVRVDVWTPALIGLLFIALGNYFGKIKPNWFMGIRTPWTLSSEEVWNKTHRFGGRLFVAAGFAMLLSPVVPSMFRFALVIVLVLALSAGTFLYSYIVYRAEKRAQADGNDNEQG